MSDSGATDPAYTVGHRSVGAPAGFKCRGCIFRCTDCGTNDHVSTEIPVLDSPFTKER